jgi:hypothetical protein
VQQKQKLACAAVMPGAAADSSAAAAAVSRSCNNSLQEYLNRRLPNLSSMQVAYNTVVLVWQSVCLGV